MATISGSIQSLTLNGRRFTVAADVECEIKSGGFKNEVLVNGDGTTRVKKTRVPWQCTPEVNINSDTDDFEYRETLKDNTLDVNTVVELVNGVRYQGIGTITGDLTYSTLEGKTKLEISGEKSMTKV